MEWTSNELGNFVSGLGNLYGGYQGMQTANNTNNQVQGLLGSQQQAAQSQLQAMQAQAAQQRQQAQEAYARSQGEIGTQNQGLQGNIDTMTSNLTALSDPNSPYMQQARQAIERKDAAAGRRSQWGDREVQLAGTLADYVGKYAPGLNNSITGARNQINQNNQGLASIYDQMNRSGSITDTNIMSLLNGMNGMATSANTTGRSAANSATNNTTGLINSAGGLIGQLGGGLMGLFGGGNPWGSSGWGTTNGYDWTNPGTDSLISGQLGGTYYGNDNYGTSSSSGDPYNTDY